MPRQITKCPHCKGDAVIRNSEQLSDLVRSATGVCKDPECGHTFKLSISIEYTISPPAKPNPNINLPLSPRMQNQQVNA